MKNISGLMLLPEVFLDFHVLNNAVQFKKFGQALHLGPKLISSVLNNSDCKTCHLHNIFDLSGLHGAVI